jgi:hypothetical protein
LEEEVARLRQEKEKLDQELAGALETGRRAGEELSNKSRELTGKNRVTLFFDCSMFLVLCVHWLPAWFTVLKVNTKKHLDELIKDRDSWKANCIKLWKGVAPVLDLISPEVPEDQPRTPKLTPVEKAQRAWDWLQQFVKDAGEFAGAHVLSKVCAHYPLVDLSRLERRYPKEVGPQEVDDLLVGLLDLSSTVIGDINLCGTATPPDQPGSDRSAGELVGASVVGDGRSTSAVSTNQAPVAPTPLTRQQGRATDQPEE